MTTFDRQRIHEICESIKDDILAKSIEESENFNEAEFIVTKKIINENIRAIEKALVEEGLFDYGVQLIQEAFMQDAMNKIKSAEKAITNKMGE